MGNGKLPSEPGPQNGQPSPILHRPAITHGKLRLGLFALHSHSHANGHHHHHAGTGNILRWSLAATGLFVVIELVAGIESHSLALLSDAGHNFTDAVALFLSWFGFYLQSKPAHEIKTYGYHRG